MVANSDSSIGTDAYKCYFNQGPGECQGPTANVQGGITASMAGGSWLAALVSGFLSDILGRKKAIMTGAVIWLVVARFGVVLPRALLTISLGSLDA
jgi:MFS family permease